MAKAVKIIECPRDAMQGLPHFIPTKVKAAYLNQLLKTGFDVIDGGSFVSPRVIPQMKDTAEVIKMLDFSGSKSKLLVIVANKRGGEDAVAFDEVSFLGFPFSISETFQQRNTNSSIDESLNTVHALQELCIRCNRQLVIYISMAFGNPYGDEWNAEIAYHWISKMVAMNIQIIALADTVGVAHPADVKYMFSHLIPAFGTVEFGAHLHSTPENWKEKLEAAWSAGCRRFDTAIKGFGGCPMAKDELVGNMATENLVEYLSMKGESVSIDPKMFELSMQQAVQVFNPIAAH